MTAPGKNGYLLEHLKEAVARLMERWTTEAGFLVLS